VAHPPGAHEDERQYVPDYATLRALLAVPVEQGHAQKQQSGRVAKSLDVNIAHELRRAGFLNAVMSYTPVDVYQGVRARKLGEPEGGFPPSEDGTDDDAS
jgi:hypothetical protein